jgi:glycine C-acetyltransferase
MLAGKYLSSRYGVLKSQPKASSKLPSLKKAKSTRPVTRQYTTKNTWSPVWSDALDEMKKLSTYKREREITSAQGAEIKIKSPKTGKELSVLNFCANNYLGLANNPQLISAAKKTLDTHGLGLGSVRFICGTQDIHKQLERQIAEFHGCEDAILYGSCFDANAGIFEALLGPEDAVFSDSLNHASIIDGVRLCKAQKLRYNHLDLDDLEQKLISTQARIKLVVSDGAFSMDGEIAPIDKLVSVCEKNGALLLIDECHATGFMGKTGKGTPEHFGVHGKVNIINSTLGKALGGATGGYTTGPKDAIDMLRQKSRPYLFSNTVAPAVVGASIEMFNMLQKDTGLRDKVEANTKRFRSRMTAAGFKLKGEVHPIAPVMLYDAALAANFADQMLDEGIYVIGFFYPVVPKDQARIRVQLSAAHTIDQVDRAVDAFIKVGKKLKVIQ